MSILEKQRRTMTVQNYHRGILGKQGVRNAPVMDADRWNPVSNLLFSSVQEICVSNATSWIALGKTMTHTNHSQLFIISCSGLLVPFGTSEVQYFWHNLQQTWGRAAFSHLEKLKKGPVAISTELYFFLSAFSRLEEPYFFCYSPVHMGKIQDMLFLDALCIWPLSQEGRWK